MQSMTGFVSKEAKLRRGAKISLELRSTNHKFLDIVFHLPEGLLSLEDALRKEIESKIKRARITCVVNIVGTDTQRVFINKQVLQSYIRELKKIKAEFSLADTPRLDTLLHLPGVLAIPEAGRLKNQIWPALKLLMQEAVGDLVAVRKKEGTALQNFLKKRSIILKQNLDAVSHRFKKAIKEKILRIKTDEERSAFLKDVDITEEIERLSYHIQNFKNKLYKGAPQGKELDFIAQEMQREANTIGAKSFDVLISGRVIQIKSELEKIREQLQNIE